MDWFERLTGFRETTGDDVRDKIEIDGPVMRSSVNGWEGHAKASDAGSATVYLTRLGGGVFGNEMSWIVDAIGQAVERHADHGLDIAIVSYRQSNPALVRLCS